MESSSITLNTMQNSLMDKENIYKSIDNDVSLIDCINFKECPVAIDFAIDYYMSKIRDNNAYKVYHLSSTLIELGRVPCKNTQALNNIRVWQCLGLSHFYQTLIRIENSNEIPDCLIIQDFDEACNISYFESHNLTIKLMHNILRIVRKLSQYHDMTCIIIYSKPRGKYVVRHLDHAVRNMVDNTISFEGSGVKIDSIYD